MPASVLKSSFIILEVISRPQRKRGNFLVKMIHKDLEICALQESGSKISTSIRKQCIIVFRVSELGTPAADTFFIHISTKSMNNGGCEEGVVSGIAANSADIPILQDRKMAFEH